MFYKNNSKKIINTKFSLVVCLLFLLYFFSNNLIYATSLTKTKNDFLIPVGNVLHIEAQLENVIVRSNIKDSPFTLGDEIISINNNTIKSYSDFSNVLNSLPDSANVIDVTLKRNNHITNIKTLKSKLEEVLTWQVKDNVGRVDRGRSEKNYQKLVAFRDCINSMDWKERDFSLFVLNMAEKAYQGDYDDVLKYLKRFIKKYGVGDEKVGEYVYIFCEKLKENGSPEQILSGIEELDRVVESQKDAGIRSRLMYLKRDMLRAAGYEKEAMRVDTLATKILNPHFYDRK